MSLPTFRPQIGDPTTSLDRFICTMESAAMGLDFTTGGQVSLWGGQLIPYCGKSPSDIAGANGHPGTSLTNAAIAWAHFGQELEQRDDAWAELQAVRKSGSAVILQGDLSSMPAGDRCSSAEVTHCVIVLPDTSVDGLSALTGDPLCSGFRWRTLRGLRAYAERLALDVRGTRSRLFYGVAPAFKLPDTSEEPMPLTVTKLKARSGIATVKTGAKRAAIEIDSRAYHWFTAGQTKRYVAEGVLVPPLDGNPGDRASVVIVGDEAAVFLKMDVNLADDPMSADIKHRVGLTVDGAAQGTEVIV